MEREKKLQITADSLLVLITLIWGTTFTITKIGVDQIPPLLYISVRFFIALGLMVLVFGKRFNNVNKDTIKAGLVLGFILSFGFATQTMGLQYTTASKAAFITGLSVILTPILAIFTLKRSPTGYAWFGALLAFIGLTTMSVEPGLNTILSWGDFLELLCAIAFAFHIVTMAKYAPKHDPALLATIQIGVTAVVTGVLGLSFETIPTQVSSDIWWGIGYMGIFATGLVLLMQSWAQKYTTPTRTAIIFTLEPVFAAIFAFLILSEAVTEKTIFGGILILSGIIIAELKGEKKELEVNGEIKT